MNPYLLSKLADHAVVHEFVAIVGQIRSSTALLLAYLGEMDKRRLYRAAAYPSVYEYCVHELHMSEQTALRRIRAARAARRFPALFDALGDGRLHLTAVVLLAPHLNPENAEVLMAMATHKTRKQIERLLAERFPQPDMPTVVRPILNVTSTQASTPAPVSALDSQLLSAPVAPSAVPHSSPQMEPLAPAPVVPCVEPRKSLRMEPLAPPAKLTPLSPERYAVQFTASKATHAKLRYAQELLGHAVPSGDIAEVLDRALDALLQQLERLKFAKATLTRPSPGSTNPRYVPAEVRRVVWERDGGQCAFVSDQGRRCGERTRVEFDHIEAVAKGGEATVANVRLCCRVHNQFEAERVFGADFMRGKREAGQSRSKSAARRGPSHDMVPRLREFGLSAEQAAEAAARCASISGVPFEERLTLALRGFAPAAVRMAPADAQCLASPSRPCSPSTPSTTAPATRRLLDTSTRNCAP